MTRSSPDRYQYDLVRTEFDVKYYLACHPDVEAAGVDALDHFMVHGWREGRNPSREFDVRYYLATNTDVDAIGMNPFVHYLQSGRLEGRLPRRPLDMWRRQIESAKPIHERQKDWGSAADVSPALSHSEVIEKLHGRNWGIGLVISVSHDDYKNSFGGIQNIISDEQQLFGENGWSYLHLSPAKPLPMLSDTSSIADFRVKLRLDGDALGVTTAQTLMSVLQEWLPEARKVELLVHHLLGHSPEIVAEIARVLRVTRTKVWLHDFFTLCSSYALMRNDVAFCGAPPTDSGACRICTYGGARPEHTRRMQRFFEELVPDVAAPSNGALQFWLTQSNYRASSHRVIAPANVYLARASSDYPATPSPRPLTVAHIGARSFLKGWNVFEELALRFKKDPRFRFVQLGAEDGSPLIGCIKNVPVKVSADNRSAMIEAVAEQNVDVVLSWSLWPETFCFAVHEGLAGGAFIVARKGAGNVWPAVSSLAPKRGVALDDLDSLFELFDSGDLERLVTSSPRLRGAVLSDRHSYGWVTAQRRLEKIGASHQHDSEKVTHG
ncbi:hypothetical protein [Burkholderia vietnamiensis]|uniref:hypothetical protein n=1 Tax=Burkholderia vietnamiensis TaxID=60552 RepID=UPI001CB4ADEA|nr:hypothetical protein [Burkholderia vietnamiensis]CAG9213440.1 conserved hypothetical protein [Burkholderia vietnamiensis]